MSIAIIEYYIKLKQYVFQTLYPTRIKFPCQSTEYSEWRKINEKILAQFSRKKDFNGYFPKISIIMPVWNTGEIWLQRAIQSVRNQTYNNWELCIADGNSTNPKIKKILKKLQNTDSRIKCVFLPENKGIAGNTNAALRLATGEFIGFLDHDDTLSDNCLFEVVRLLNLSQQIDIIYSDNDRIDELDCRNSPFFKFDFSLPALLSTNYPFHFFLCRKSLIESIGGLREGFEGAQDYDLILRLVERTPIENIAHIAKVLYHWRTLPTSSAHSASAKPYAYEAGKRAIEGYLERNQIPGEVYELEPGSYRVKKKIISKPKVILAVVTDNKTINPIFIEFLDRLLSIRTYQIDTLFIPTIYSEYFHNLNVYLINELRSDLMERIRADNNLRIIFVDGRISSYSHSHLHSDWIESLIEHFDYFPCGVVGTGSLTFCNIICNVQRNCGPVFCLDGDLFTSFCNDDQEIADYDNFQIEISDFSSQKGYNNLYTPFCIGNAINYSRILDYYSNITGKFFTGNMSFYLPDNLKVCLERS